jgi:ankyrin repeat protein
VCRSARVTSVCTVAFPPGGTPLHYAATQRGHYAATQSSLDVVEMLLMRNADVDARDIHVRVA